MKTQVEIEWHGKEAVLAEKDIEGALYQYFNCCSFTVRELPQSAELNQIKQMQINQKFLIGCIDAIHAALCPGQTGTWQVRAEQAVIAANTGG